MGHVLTKSILQMHTAVKISPQYSGSVVYVLDASRSVPVVQSLLDSKNQVAFSEDIKEQYAEMREVGSQMSPQLLISVTTDNAEDSTFGYYYVAGQSSV